MLLLLLLKPQTSAIFFLFFVFLDIIFIAVIFCKNFVDATVSDE